jgi:hypothetical protein
MQKCEVTYRVVSKYSNILVADFFDPEKAQQYADNFSTTVLDVKIVKRTTIIEEEELEHV